MMDPQNLEDANRKGEFGIVFIVLTVSLLI